MKKIVCIFLSLLILSCTSKTVVKTIEKQDVFGTYNAGITLKDTTGLAPTEVVGFALCNFVYTFRTDSVDITSNMGALSNVTTFAWNLKNDTLTIDKPKGQSVYLIKDTADGFFLQGKIIDILLKR